MLNTASDMYKATLAGIRKEATAVLPPDEWMLLINESLLNWVRDKMKDVEFNDKIVDDLQPLMVTYIATPNMGVTPAGYFFDYPVAPKLPIKILNVSFKIVYSGNSCFADGVISDWLKAKRMTTDIENVKDYYSRPKDNRLYFMPYSSYIRLYTGTSSIGSEMRMVNLVYPTPITINPDQPSEIRPLQRQEVVDLAVRTYLERVKEERYQSNLNEDALKQGKK